MCEAEEQAQRTLGHYSRRAIPFWEGTKDHDVSQVGLGLGFRFRVQGLGLGSRYNSGKAPLNHQVSQVIKKLTCPVVK